MWAAFWIEAVFAIAGLLALAYLVLGSGSKPLPKKSRKVGRGIFFPSFYLYFAYIFIESREFKNLRYRRRNKWRGQ